MARQERDEERAAHWLERAAEREVPVAQYNLGLLLMRGEGTAADERRGAELVQRAAEGGLAEAQAKLGLMYEHGSGVQQNLVSAHLWYSLAAASGAGDAALQRERLERSMEQYQIAYSQRLAGEWSASRADAGGDESLAQAR